MSRLEELVDDIKKILLPNPVHIEAKKVDGYQDLVALLDRQVDKAELDGLSPDELRALNSLRITVYRSGTADADVGRKQVAAIWRGMAKQAVLKLSDGHKIHAAMKLFLDGVETSART
jgi:hypothetical protein